MTQVSPDAIPTQSGPEYEDDETEVSYDSEISYDEEISNEDDLSEEEFTAVAPTPKPEQHFTFRPKIAKLNSLRNAGGGLQRTESGAVKPFGIRLDKVKHENWEEVQFQTFTKWTNFHLKKQGKEPIENIQTGFCNGLNLLYLLQSLSQGRFQPKAITKSPMMKVHMIYNINLALEFMNSDGVQRSNISAEDIINGNEKMIAGLLWTQILHYQMKKGKGRTIPQDTQQSGGRSPRRTANAKPKVSSKLAGPNTDGLLSSSLTSQPKPEAGLTVNQESVEPITPRDGVKQGSEKGELIQWVNNQISPFSVQPISNLTTDFADGKAFAALTASLDPKYNFEEAIKLEPQAMIDNAMDHAEDHLNIPKLLEGTHVANRMVDDKSIMTYLSLAQEAHHNKLQAASLVNSEGYTAAEQIKEKKDQSIDNKHIEMTFDDMEIGEEEESQQVRGQRKKAPEQISGSGITLVEPVVPPKADAHVTRKSVELVDGSLIFQDEETTVMKRNPRKGDSANEPKPLEPGGFAPEAGGGRSRERNRFEFSGTGLTKAEEGVPTSFDIKIACTKADKPFFPYSSNDEDEKLECEIRGPLPEEATFTKIPAGDDPEKADKSQPRILPWKWEPVVNHNTFSSGVVTVPYVALKEGDYEMEFFCNSVCVHQQPYVIKVYKEGQMPADVDPDIIATRDVASDSDSGQAICATPSSELARDPQARRNTLTGMGQKTMHLNDNSDNDDINNLKGKVETPRIVGSPSKDATATAPKAQKVVALSKEESFFLGGDAITVPTKDDNVSFFTGSSVPPPPPPPPMQAPQPQGSRLFLSRIGANLGEEKGEGGRLALLDQIKQFKGFDENGIEEIDPSSGKVIVRRRKAKKKLNLTDIQLFIKYPKRVIKIGEFIDIAVTIKESGTGSPVNDWCGVLVAHVYSQTPIPGEGRIKLTIPARQKEKNSNVWIMRFEPLVKAKYIAMTLFNYEPVQNKYTFITVRSSRTKSLYTPLDLLPKSKEEKEAKERRARERDAEALKAAKAAQAGQNKRPVGSSVPIGAAGTAGPNSVPIGAPGTAGPNSVPIGAPGTAGPNSVPIGAPGSAGPNSVPAKSNAAAKLPEKGAMPSLGSMIVPPTMPTGATKVVEIKHHKKKREKLNPFKRLLNRAKNTDEDDKGKEDDDEESEYSEEEIDPNTPEGKLLLESALKDMEEDKKKGKKK
eukprot:TRINITY_DN3452_c0_g1_i1.p1 TRINITY_DN3452_c0_g1~~TRINITY_DN3452_c0_g1_i1.p1  ORF type:complete len:1226 (+),score=567.06 TRINITY_DN3452_c0_g1_i1:98-3679(+)